MTSYKNYDVRLFLEHFDILLFGYCRTLTTDRTWNLAEQTFLWPNGSLTDLMDHCDLFAAYIRFRLKEEYDE